MRPVLVFGWGNPSRGDDALGPLFVHALRARVGSSRADFLEDFQLQVEHALDLAGRERILLVDASLDCAAPFEASLPQPRRDRSITSHALTPDALLQVFKDLHGAAAPPCTMLAIRGERFELGEPPSPGALAHLEAALSWAQRWIEHGHGARP